MAKPQHKPMSGPQVVARLFVLECVVTESLEILTANYPENERTKFLVELREKALARVKEGTQHLEAMMHAEMYVDELIEEIKS